MVIILVKGLARLKKKDVSIQIIFLFQFWRKAMSHFDSPQKWFSIHSALEVYFSHNQSIDPPVYGAIVILSRNSNLGFECVSSGGPSTAVTAARWRPLKGATGAG